MPLNVTARVEDNFAVLELTGPLTLGPSLSSLRETALRTLDESKVAGMILHVARVTTTDSAGLGELTVVYTFASKRGCPVMLAEVTSSMRKMLEVTHLDALLPSAVDLQSAKKELKGRRLDTLDSEPRA
jgi:anti-anti-sigma factor